MALYKFRYIIIIIIIIKMICVCQQPGTISDSECLDGQSILQCEREFPPIEWSPSTTTTHTSCHRTSTSR